MSKKIIDFEIRGCAIKLYIGECDDWGGDDWDDAPYEFNAGPVYGEFVKGHKDIAFPFDDLVLEPCDGELNSPYCKDDFAARRTPCIIVVPAELAAERPWGDDYRYWVGNAGIKKFYYGDEMEEDK